MTKEEDKIIFDSGRKHSSGNHLPNDDNGEERPQWKNKIEYMLALIGYTVGLSSVWRFPYLCLHNGGGAFLIPILFFLILSGFPTYFLELAIGQFSGRSPITVWTICPLLEGIGFSMVVLCFMVTWYSTAMMSWILLYLFYSFYPTHPWASCENEWNTPQCIVSRNFSLNVTGNVSNEIPHSIENSAAYEFWRYKVFNESQGIQYFGSIQPHLAISLLFANILMFLCIIKGVRSVGKVSYLTATMPYILLLVILIRSLSLEGSLDGIIMFFKPDFSRLADFQVWLQASIQVFYSLGPSWGGVVTMSSYNKVRNNCLKDAIIVCLVDGFSAIYCGLVIFTILGFLAHETGIPIEKISNPGPGIVFITYPEVLTRLPLPQLWSILFFLMLVLVGLDSLFGMLETIVSGITDMYPHVFYGRRKLYLLGSIFVVYISTSLLFSSQNAVYLYQVIDWYTSAFSLFFTTMLECIAVGWIYGAEKFNTDFRVMTGRSLPIFIRISICIIVPVFMVVAFFCSIIAFEHPTYGSYQYPSYIGTIGIILGLLPIAPVFFLFFWRLLKSKGSIVQRFKKEIKPSNWMPNDDRAAYTYEMFQYNHMDAMDKIMCDLIGRTNVKSHSFQNVSYMNR